MQKDKALKIHSKGQGSVLFQFENLIILMQEHWLVAHPADHTSYQKYPEV